MDKGTKVYRAYIGISPGVHWVDQGVVTEISLNGVPLVDRGGGLMMPLDSTWHTTRAGANRDIVAHLARTIGEWQAKLDAIRDEMLHDDLTTEEAAA